MKTKLIALALLLTMLLGTFGCAGVGAVANDGEAIDARDPNLISGKHSGLLAETDTIEADNIINLAAVSDNDVDGNGNPLAMFQIVYNIQAGLIVKDQCDALSSDIYETTGINVPVVHSSMPQKTYEIMVGKVARSETIDIIDTFDLGDSDFVITVIGTRILIYAETDQALVSAVLYFIDQVAYRDDMNKVYGMAADYDYTYHPNENPPVVIDNIGEYYVEFSLQNAAAMFTYARISYTGNKGWRLQTKFRKTDEFKNDGASQVLAYSMGEYELGTEDERFFVEKISASQVGDVLTLTAPDGVSRVEISLDVFEMNFYSSADENAELSSTVTNITCNAGGSSITGLLEEDEALFGTGERMNSANQRGKRIEMFSKDIWSQATACYMVIPLLCSSRGSGVFANIYEHMVFDLDSAKDDTWRILVTGANLDCYIFTTEQIEDVITAYSDLSGYAGMPEEWTYGMIVCAYGPDLSQKWTASINPSDDGRGEGIYEMIANMEAYDLPWTGVLAEAWGPYNANKHKDLKELCDYVHGLGKKFLVYMRVGSASASMSGFQSSYLLTQNRHGTVSNRLPDTTADTNNPDVGSGSGRTNVYLDITNPEAVAWFFDDYWDYLANEIGVDGCKIDFCETLPENFELNYFDENIPTGGSHHWYPSAFCAMYFDMISSKPDSGMCYTRGGGIGAQRAPYMWAGDQMRYWAGIKYQLTAVLSSGLSGVPFMSYDMSGYQYGNETLHKDIDHESKVFIRGTQYSAFTVCIQTHGKVKRSYQFADYELKMVDPATGKVVTDAEGNPVMVSGEYITELYRAYTKLHEHLTPYITELNEEACTKGTPVMRHLILQWQDDKNVYNIEDQYMFGDAFMIAPILSDNYTREVYLPEGNWKDLNDGTVYNVGPEGMRLPVTANLAQLPTYYNLDCESETAADLVPGIEEIYDYAETLIPQP